MPKLFRVTAEIGGAQLFRGSERACRAFIERNGYTLEYRSSCHPHFYVSGNGLPTLAKRRA